MMQSTLTKTIFLSVVALIAFAGNSVLCRLALSDNAIDPAAFTIIRLVSGVFTLLPLLLLSQRKVVYEKSGSWLSAFMLFAYALLFSYAYVSIDTATGALILFGAVQITLVFVSFLKGNRLSLAELSGVALALSGFVYLVLPELQKPSLGGFIMMSIAGIAWAMYTVGGQGSSNALRDTAFNFLRTIPLVIVLLVVTLSSFSLTPYGVGLAIASGAITSGLGYAIWYAALPNLTTTQAAVIQLFVPVIAAFGGSVFANEAITLRLTIAAGLVLGGIMLVIMAKQKSS